jgi:5S rRNA maturation endonuclease (ribonuclease M5)
MEGGSPGEDGEWGMHCPLHDDNTRSASLNVKKGKWYCNVCAIGGDTDELLDELYRQELSGKREFEESPSIAWVVEEDDPVTEAEVDRYHKALMRTKSVRSAFRSRRGLSLETLRKFQIGWDNIRAAYTIPIRDVEGKLVNLRRYQLDPPEGRRKIWGVAGVNMPSLFPVAQLDHHEVIICEGELDALMLVQHGFNAVTRTGAADVWKPNWNHFFDDKVVYLCHDRDEKGETANNKIGLALKGHAREIYVIELPYELDPKHGKDVTDYFHEDKHTATEFKQLMADAAAMEQRPTVSEKDLTDVGVLDSFGSDAAGRKLRMRVTITGKKSPPFLLPAEVDYRCTQDAGVKCNICPMKDNNGIMQRHLDPHDPLVLDMMGSTAPQMTEHLRKLAGAQKCNRLKQEVGEYRTVEELYVRPSVDKHTSQGSGDYTTRKIISVGRHDSLPNNTVEVVGSIFPSPRGQHNEFQAWEVAKLETSIDKFEMTPKVYAQLKKLQTKKPLARLAEIARWHEQNTTRIVGRLEMHALFDLVWHSVISFPFGGQTVNRGWLEALVVGDTRTGKSEVAAKMSDCYETGEIVSCESATYAGIVGGLQQLGSGKEWEITWGAIPINDRRLVVLDEVSGLTQEQIAQMSSIRSSGEAQLTKIRSERTWARTRLVWLGNPRNGRMADYTYGVQAIRPLIGNNEDIARFDLAMSVRADEVKSSTINSDWEEANGGSGPWTPELLKSGVLWAWSRTPDDVVWEDGAEHAVLEAAVEMGKRYTEVPPLVQAANARIKIARVAVALAARTFSTPDGHKLVVGNHHVADAVKFIDKLYSSPGFGYAELSREALSDAAEANKHRDEAQRYLVSKVGLSKFLRSMTGSFRRQDLEDMLNMNRDEANAVVNMLWQMRLITRQGPNIKINPVLHELLREVKN